MGKFLPAALVASKLGAKEVMKHYRNHYSVKYKGRDDVVTEADLASERAIINCLSKKFPAHSFNSEEAGSTANNSECCWHIDPIDGTNNFFTGLPIFGISVALYEGTTPLVGVLNFPTLNEIYWAEKGMGSFCNGKRIHVSKRAKLHEALILLDDPYDIRVFKGKEEVTKKIFHLRVPGAAIFSYAMVARGAADVCMHVTIKPHDCAAGALIIREAGGMVDEYPSGPWGINSRSIICSNGLLHKKFQSLLR